jgi:hypothetical protein
LFYLISGGQAIASRLGQQISKTTKKIQAAIKEYNALPDIPTALPSTVKFEEVSQPSSKLWCDLGKALPSEESRMQDSDRCLTLAMRIARCKEEIGFLTSEMQTLLTHYSDACITLKAAYSNLQKSKETTITSALLAAFCVRGLDCERTYVCLADSFLKYGVAHDQTDQLNFFNDLFNSEVTSHSAVVLDDALSHDDEDLFDLELETQDSDGSSSSEGE